MKIVLVAFFASLASAVVAYPTLEDDLNEEIFYPDLYAEAGEGELGEEPDADGAPLPPAAVLSEADNDLALALGGGGGGVEKRSSRAHALRVRNDASFHALRVRRAGATRGYALRVRKMRPSSFALRVRKDMSRGHALRVRRKDPAYLRHSLRVRKAEAAAADEEPYLSFKRHNIARNHILGI